MAWIEPDHTKLRKRLQSARRPIVFTNGCFDILHRGHVDYLQHAKAKGQTLVIALNTDESVRTLNKSPGRPFNPLEDRMAVMAALACVDFVTAFDESTPLTLIQQLNPEILVKGGDWALDTIVGAGHVQANGGEVYSIPFRYPCSTTSLLERIRDA
ncbi:MAG: D-glycero-beta-D-manno-heptose 1-phosphate adenylyltransferase [Arenicellales bacterium WSBS_2016_MAG_OTU3]